MTSYCAYSNELHRPVIRLETNEVLIEYCEHCKEEAIFTKSRQGRIDNESYRIFHRRDLLQPSHAEYEKEWGHPV